MRYDLQIPSEQSLAIAYALEVLIRTRETLVTVFHDTPADLRDPARKLALRSQFKEISIAIEQFQPPAGKAL